MVANTFQEFLNWEDNFPKAKYPDIITEKHDSTYLEHQSFWHKAL